MAKAALHPSVSVKSQVTNWLRVEHAGGFSNWTPTLECGHTYYGGFHPHPDLPVEMECGDCRRLARQALLAGQA